MMTGLKSQFRIISILLGLASLQEVSAQQSWSVGTGAGGTGNYFLYPYPGTTASPGKLGLNLPNTTDPAGMQRISIGIGSAATEWIFGQYQGVSGAFRVGAGQFVTGSAPTYWSGIDMRVSASSTEIGFVTSTGTTSTEKMTIKPDGSIGIGTSTTSAKLDLQDATGNRTTIFNSNLTYGNGVTGSYSANKMTAAYGIASTGTLTGLEVNVSNPSTGGAYAASFLGGNVGIGSASPATALHVRKDDGVANGEHPLIRVDRNGANNTTDPVISMGYRADGSAPKRLFLGPGNDFPIDFRTSLAPQAMTILNNGNVGVNQNTPASKLDINGTVLVRGFNYPAAGTGVEIDYNGIAGAGRIFAFDRTSGVHMPFRVGKDFIIDPSGNVSGVGSAMFGNGVGSPAIILAGAAGSPRSIQFNSNTTGGTGARWTWEATNDAETGNNAGTALRLTARADNGTGIDNVIQITRAALGPIMLNRPVIMDKSLSVIGHQTNSGSLTVGTNATPYEIGLNGPSAQERAMSFKTAGLNRWKIFANTNAETGSNNGSDLTIAAYNDGGNFLSNAITIARTDRTVTMADNAKVNGSFSVSGKVSIKTPSTATSGDLAVRATGIWRNGFENTLELVGPDRPTIRFTSSKQGNTSWISGALDGSLYFGVGQDAPTGEGKTPIIITAGSNVALATNTGGQVIVGGNTASIAPGMKLNVVGDARVSGTLHAGTIKTASWGIEPTPPDYVFEKGYKLASLDHVEKFVNEKKHLPEIPSAKEIMAGGLDLADMNMKLLKKVEELTLYAISQNKRTTAQDKEIAELKKTVHAMADTRGEKK